MTGHHVNIESAEVIAEASSDRTGGVDVEVDLRFKNGRVFYLIMGSAFLVTASYVALIARGEQSRQSFARHTVRALLESREFADIAAHNILNGSGSSDVEFVKKHVVEGLQKIIDSIRDNDPDLFRQLHRTSLSRKQNDSVFTTLKGMGDPRIRSMGYEVAVAVDEGIGEGREGVKRRLMEKFRVRLSELQRLREGVFPVAERGLVANRLFGSGEGETLIHQRRLASPTEVGWEGLKANAGLSDQKIAVYALMFERAMSILAGLIEQVRVILNQTVFLGDAFGQNMKVPRWVTSLVGGLAFVTQLSTCAKEATSDELKLYMCPMKYASALADLLSGITELFPEGSTVVDVHADGADLMGSQKQTTTLAGSLRWTR